MNKTLLVWMISLLTLSACTAAKPASTGSGVGTIVAATLQAMTAAAPPEEQASGLPVVFNNVSFTIPLELNASAIATTDTQWEFPSVNPSSGPMPEHVIFQFTNYPVEADYPASEGARIMVFRSSEYAAYGFTEQEAVTALLAGQDTEQPVPEPLMQGRFYAQTRPVAFQNGHGFRYLNELMEGIGPINNRGIFYYYQGVTNDGAYFVAAIFHVSAPFLVADDKNDSITPPDGILFNWEPGMDYRKYLDDISEKLNEAPAENFTPSLSMLDKLIESLQVANP